MRSPALTDEALRAPVNVTWEITEDCNLACRHCLSADLRAAQRGELAFEECRRIVDDLAAADVFQINFGGGEPFLRDDFMELLAYAQAKGITTCVSTNGTLLDDRLVARLAAMDGLFLQVSLDGATAETNDAIRGAGTFARVLHGVACLRRHEVRDFSLNMVVTRTNVHEVGRLLGPGRGPGREGAPVALPPLGRGLRQLGRLPADGHATPGALGVPGRAHRDPHRRLVLLADAREPATPRAHHVWRARA